MFSLDNEYENVDLEHAAFQYYNKLPHIFNVRFIVHYLMK